MTNIVQSYLKNIEAASIEKGGAMYDTETLNDLIESYMIYCHGKPTKCGLADWLEVSPTTVFNVIRGSYNQGILYGREPSFSRKIDNSDFIIVRSLFKAGKDE